MKKIIRRTKIVGTIGPASEDEETFRKLVEAGLNVARINFSHGGYEENKDKIEMIKRVRAELNKPVAILLDTKGPEIRTGMLESRTHGVQIIEGQKFTFVYNKIIGNKEKVSLSYTELYREVKPGSRILVDDGELEFEVVEINEKDIICKALNTGKLGSRKTVNIPGLNLDLPAMTQKDVEDITKGVYAGVDIIAASFVRRLSDVLAVRELLSKIGGEKVKIISKIENQEGIDNYEHILRASDGVMVARGDLGIEIPLEQVPTVQKRLIKQCRYACKPSITATQMLESMITEPRPTRAEVSDVANAVYDLTGAIMLSGESAMGKHPIECVETMDKIAKTVESSIKFWKRFNKRHLEVDKNDWDASIAYIACLTANHIEADAVVAYTHKGDSIRKIAGLGLGCPVFAITDDVSTYHQLAITWNVTPILVERNGLTIDQTIQKGIDILKEEGTLEKGDLVVLAGGARILPDDTTNNKVVGGFVRI